MSARECSYTPLCTLLWGMHSVAQSGYWVQVVHHGSFNQDQTKKISINFWEGAFSMAVGSRCYKYWDPFLGPIDRDSLDRVFFYHRVRTVRRAHRDPLRGHDSPYTAGFFAPQGIFGASR